MTQNAPSMCPDRAALLSQFHDVRRLTNSLCTPLAIEDFVVQSMPEASPVKWHLAHTSWFFETFVLARADSPYRPFDASFNYLFNSYYNAIGARVPRAQRGMLSRPMVTDIFRYRRHIDDHMTDLLERCDDATLEILAPVLTLGLHHEQQHQELILTDIKHAFASNPLRPAYRVEDEREVSRAGVSEDAAPWRWLSHPAGIREIGHGGDGFAFDNEGPRHRQYVEAFQIASRPVSNGEFLAFMEDGGYRRPELWLSDGWDTCVAQQWTAPLYWDKRDGGWQVMTLWGLRKLNAAEPVCHVSYYEADAYARWAGAGLPSEFEWETASQNCPVSGNMLESDVLHPRAAPAAHGLPVQLFGDVWEWTRSPYTPYPGFQPAAGAIGEYNGKFMCNQMVLRGGSCATPPGHIRSTYRNFFPPAARWQFAGIRMAQRS